jgi:transposase
MDKPEAEKLYDSGKEPTVARLLEQDNQIEALKKKIASLSQNSSNSSKPPSSDGPGVKRYPEKPKPKGRKAGGQKGHKGKKREILPPEEMDAIHYLYPADCEKCGSLLLAGPDSTITQRHQVTELPVIKPIMTEYRCHGTRCSCGHFNMIQPPEEVAMSNFGPRVHAAVAYLAANHNVTRRGMVEIMGAFFNIDMSLGATWNMVERVSDACEPTYNTLKRYCTKALYLNADETGWKNNGQRRWLWTFVADICVIFVIAASRGSKVIKATLGENYDGILCSDDFSAYSAYHEKGIRQLCWAHLIRKLKGLKDSRSSPDAYRFGASMLGEIGRLFSFWHAFRTSENATRQELWLATALIRGRMKRLCNHYAVSDDGSVRTRAKRFLKTWDCLFVFLLHEGVEPTNNAAERALRHAVQWRKICFGSKSDKGERFTERILTITRTCRMQGRNPFEYLADLVTASFGNRSLPAIIPESTHS